MAGIGDFPQAEVVDPVDAGGEEAPHHVAIACSPLECLAKGVPGLLRLIENISLEDVDPKHRRLRVNNATLQERVLGPLPGAVDVLCFLGYTPCEEAGESLLCLDTTRHSPAAAEQEVRWLKKLVARRWRPLPWPCPTCTLQNKPGSTVCAACDAPRPAWAAAPTLPPPTLVIATVPAAERTAHANAVTATAEAVQRRRARGEALQERERILAEARADRQRFETTASSVVDVPAVSAPSSAASQSSGRAPPTRVLLRVRFPDGSVAENDFAATDVLALVFEHVDGLLRAMGTPSEDYALLQAIPRRVFLREVLGTRALRDLGFASGTTLSVLRAEDRGRVQSGGVETALLTGDIEGLSYEEILELESRIGEGKRPKRMTKREREASTKVFTYGGGQAALEGTEQELIATPLVLAPHRVQERLKFVWRQEVPGFDASKYACRRVSAKAPDGARIPINMVYAKSVFEQDPDGPKPCMLYGYGSYGICVDPSFDAHVLPYLDRGVVYCIASVRGGGEMGRYWYEEQGKYLTKRNTFTDFIACAEHLIEKGITAPDRLAIEGRSAGGLLVGSVLNMRPDLFCVAVACVPFVDVMNTMCDPSIPLTTGEWEEWGNPNEWKYFDYMLSYSPYDNVRRMPYPDILITAGLWDPRVAYWEPAKWASKLRVNNMSLTSEILLKMDLEVGHFSASDRYRYKREKAFEQAVVLDKLRLA